MCDFPLFDTINRDIPDELEEFTANEKEIFISNFKKLNETVHELIYVLIRVYDMKNEGRPEKLPFNSKEIKAGLKFDFDFLPLRLKHILNKFISIELQN